jgi:hypothetical protein
LSTINRERRKKGGMVRQQMAITMRVALEGRLKGYKTPGIPNFAKPIIVQLPEIYGGKKFRQ